jgi:type IV pilus assembly protein PilM
MRLFPSTSQTADRPRLAVEVAPDGVLAGRTAAANAALTAAAFVPLQTPFSAGLTAPVFPDREQVREALVSALESVDADTRDLTLILPDACTRILLLDFDTLPAKPQEALPLVRFRLRRMLPFDADTAAVSYQPLRALKLAGSGAVTVIAAAMPGDVREDFEAVVREVGREPGVLLPATLAALGALPSTGSHLLVHTGRDSMTTAITREGELVLYRRTEYVDSAPGEIAQAVLIAAAYFEDTLRAPLTEVWTAGLESPETLRHLLDQDGGWRIPLRSLVGSDSFATGSAPAQTAASRFTSVLGALRG